MQTVSEMPPPHTRGRGRPERPIWNELLDGQVHTVTLADDFPSCSTLAAVRTQAYGAAKRRGLKIRSCVVDDMLYVEAYPRVAS